MNLLLFKIKLAWHLSIFLIKLGANFSNKTKPIILGSFVVLILVLITGISIITKNTTVEKIIKQTTMIPQETSLYTLQEITASELEIKLSYWKRIEKKQPHSRDVLLNISQLYSALGKQELSDNYLEKAIAIDPNHPTLQY